MVVGAYPCYWAIHMARFGVMTSHTGMLPQAIDYRLLLGYLRDNMQVVIG